MSWLSEESRLLVENWDTVEAIFEAEQRLRSELTALLYSVEGELARYDWWHDGWVFVRYQDAQVYIAHQNWQRGDSFAIWIGVEGVTPQNIFGTGSPPQLYVWINRKDHSWASTLLQALKEDEEDVLGELDHKANRYLVRHAVTKYLPEEDGDFAGRARQQIAGFFAHYARALVKRDGIIQEHTRQRPAGA